MLHDLAQFRDRSGVFADRTDAGRVLALMLGEYRGTDTLVMAIPAGGVPVGAEIARALNLPLDLAVVSKITLPWSTEAGYGAVAWDGTMRLNKQALAYFGLSEAEEQEGIARTTEKVNRRATSLRQGKPFPDLTGRAVILVDDGLASGFTMRVAIEALQKAGASRIIVAVPTALEEVAAQMDELVTAVYCPNLRHNRPFAVAEAYRHWYDVSEAEAKEVLTALPDDPLVGLSVD